MDLGAAGPPKQLSLGEPGRGPRGAEAKISSATRSNFRSLRLRSLPRSSLLIFLLARRSCPRARKPSRPETIGTPPVSNPGLKHRSRVTRNQQAQAIALRDLWRAPFLIGTGFPDKSHEQRRGAAASRSDSYRGG
jgi:hypothetical protein